METLPRERVVLRGAWEVKAGGLRWLRGRRGGRPARAEVRKAPVRGQGDRKALQPGGGGVGAAPGPLPSRFLPLT